MESTEYMSHHATQRSQQRGIPMRLIEAVLDHCDHDVLIGDDCRALRVSRSAARAVARAGENRQVAERLPGLVVVWSDRTGQIVTVLHDNGQNAARRYWTRG